MTLHRRDQEQNRVWFVHPEVITATQHHQWFEGYLRRDDDYVFIIEENRDFRKPVGQISLYNIDWDLRQGEFGRLLIGEEEAKGMGIAKEASGLLLDYAFTTLGLSQIELVVKHNNEAAISIYRAYGFREVCDVDGWLKMVRLRITQCPVKNEGQFPGKGE